MSRGIIAMAGIFISYRRADAEGWAGRLSDSLKAELGRVNIFRDIEDIPPGVEFDTYITNAVGACDVLIALIGPRWLNVTDSAGKRRLDDPRDFTRLEIVGALKRNVRVIPTLVGDAVLPPADELPEDLRPLVRRQAYELSDARWPDDCRRLCEVLRPIVKREGGLSGKLVTALLAAALLIGGASLWFSQQGKAARERQEIENRQVEEQRIATEQELREKLLREQQEKDSAARAAAAEEQRKLEEQRQVDEERFADEADAKARDDLLREQREKEQERIADMDALVAAQSRAKRALDASMKTIARIDADVRVGMKLAQRARIAAESAGRYAATDKSMLSDIKRVRDTGYRAQMAFKELKIREEQTRGQLAAIEKTVEETARTSDAASATRGSESAERFEKLIEAAADDIDTQLSTVEKLTASAEAQLAEVISAMADQPKASADSGDEVVITSIDPPTSKVLSASVSQTLRIDLRVTLASEERAIVAIFLEQYPESAGGCTGATHRTNGGTYIPVRKGTRDVSAELRTRVGRGASFIAVGTNLWTDVNGKAGTSIRAFGVNPRFCFRMTP